MTPTPRRPRTGSGQESVAYGLRCGEASLESVVEALFDLDPGDDRPEVDQRALDGGYRNASPFAAVGEREISALVYSHRVVDSALPSPDGHLDDPRREPVEVVEVGGSAVGSDPVLGQARLVEALGPRFGGAGDAVDLRLDPVEPTGVDPIGDGG